MNVDISTDSVFHFNPPNRQPRHFTVFICQTTLKGPYLQLTTAKRPREKPDFLAIFAFPWR